MTSTKVAVRIRVKLADGKFRFCKPVAVANGRFKPLYALVNGVAAHHPEGVYYLRYTDRGKRVWETIGRDHNLVNAAQKRRENILMSRQLGIQVVGDSSGSESSRRIIQSAVDEYIAEIKASSRANGTAQHYENTLHLFVEYLVYLNPLRPATKRVLEDLDRRDILHFMSFLKEHRNAPRTVFNRVGYLNTFLRHHGIIELLPKKDMPKFTEKLVAAYTEDEIRALLAVPSPQDRLLFLVFFCGSALASKKSRIAPGATFRLPHAPSASLRSRTSASNPKIMKSGPCPFPANWWKSRKNIVASALTPVCSSRILKVARIPTSCGE